MHIRDSIHSDFVDSSEYHGEQLNALASKAGYSTVQCTATQYNAKQGKAKFAAFWQGACVRHRLRQPACKSLCNDIMQMQHCMAELRDAQNAPDAYLHRQLKQQLRVRRWALQIGCLLSSLPLLHHDWHSSKGLHSVNDLALLKAVCWLAGGYKCTQVYMYRGTATHEAFDVVAYTTPNSQCSYCSD